MKFILLLMLISCCEASNKCPCGEKQGNNGKCYWNFYWIDERPECAKHGQPDTYKPKETKNHADIR